VIDEANSMSTIDAAKYHHGRGAKAEEDAAYHIGLFLRFCAQCGLASAQHQTRLAELTSDPAKYLIKYCGGKLWSSDLTPDGAAFAERIYKRYLDEISDIAMGCDRDVYTLRTDPDRAEVEQLIFEYLDRRLEKFGGSKS
jgi:hypothetical protein